MVAQKLATLKLKCFALNNRMLTKLVRKQFTCKITLSLQEGKWSANSEERKRKCEWREEVHEKEICVKI